MDVTTQMNAAITKLQETQLPTNLVLAGNLQELLNKYTASKLKTSLQKQANSHDDSNGDITKNHQEKTFFNAGLVNLKEKDFSS